VSTTSPPPGGPTGPEYLEQGGGGPVPPSETGGNGRRTALVAGGAVVLLAAAGAGTWAAMTFLGGGAQPSEALPAGTLAYASVDLDPSGAQKIEALRTLNKFPAIKKELGLDADDDVRRKIFEEIFDTCDDVSYADDVEPWLGSTFAVAAVEAGEEKPSPVGVLEVTDSGAAETGLAKLAKCSEDDSGFTVDGDWAFLAETDDIVQQVADGEGSLSDDADYQRWTDEVGDPGIVTMYAAPDAGPLMADLMADEMGIQGASASGDGVAQPAVAVPASPLPEQMRKALEDFGGAAATVRFADGAAELEFAADVPQQQGMLVPAEGANVDLVEGLPDDTAVAVGASLPEGWADRLVEQLGSAGIPPEQVEQGLAMAEQQTGLSLPEDLETLLGEQFAVALSGDLDIETLMNSADPSGLPLGVKVRGDSAAIEEIMGKVGQRSGMPQMFETESSGDVVSWSLSPDFRGSLAEGGSLGETDAYQAVVPDSDEAASVVFVNFRAGDWLSGLTQMDPEAGANVDPLGALGISGRFDDGTSRGLVKLTTD